MPDQPSQAFHSFTGLIARIAAVEIEPGSIGLHTTLAGDLLLDSISLISLMALSEEHFGISLTEHAEQVANLRTVGDALELIESLTTARA